LRVKATRDLEGHQGSGAEPAQEVWAIRLQATDGVEMNGGHGLNAVEDRTTTRIGRQRIEGVVPTHRPRQVLAVEASADEVAVQEKKRPSRA
jgi:hypothetical protein